MRRCQQAQQGQAQQSDEVIEREQRLHCAQASLQSAHHEHEQLRAQMQARSHLAAW